MTAILKPIVLWTPTATLTSDEACTSIYQYQLPPPPSSIPAPYHTESPPTHSLSYIPPLQYFCIKALVEWPDQVHPLAPAPLRYQAPSNHNHFDILQALIPIYRPFSPDHDVIDMRLVDPRLWAVLAQIYNQLPPPFRTYTLPLSDVHLPLLQRIPSTSHFSLITILSLSTCRQLTDDTVVELRELHTLAALDASVTALGSWGVYRLAKSLSWSDGEDDDEAPQRRGPWGLRVLYLNNCLNVDNKVLSYLPRFPLLSVVDLRGTTCRPWLERNLSFNASSDVRLYDPTNLTGVLAHLSSLTEKPSTLFSTRTPYILRVDSLYHKTKTTPHALPTTNPWDPYSEEDDRELGMEIAKGRRDVFLPPKPERHHNPCKPCLVQEKCELGGTGNPELHSDEDGDYERNTPKEESDTSSEWKRDNEDEDENENESEDGHEDGRGGDEQPPGPWDMSNPQWGEGLSPRRVREEPRPSVPRSWIDAAQDEMRIHRDCANADRFYMVPAPLLRRTSSVPGLAAARSHDTSTSTSTTDPKPKPPDRLMLFRPPPPWSSLPSRPPPPPQSRRSGMATSVFASSSAAYQSSSNATQPPPKRRHPADVAPADQARKRMRAITSMQSIFSMVQNHSVTAAGKGKELEKEREQASTPSSGPATRANPFARKPHEAVKVPLSSVLRRLQPLTSAPAVAPIVERARPPSERKPPQHPKPGPSTKLQADARPPPKVQGQAGRKIMSKRPAPPPFVGPSATAGAAQTTDPALSRPAKKLKPITTLPVPEWPGKPMKPLSEHKKKLQPPPPKAQKQTTLPAASSKVQRRVSAPMRLELAPAKPEKGVKSSIGKLKSKGAEKHVHKSEGGEKRFDWQGWSAG